MNRFSRNFFVLMVLGFTLIPTLKADPYTGIEGVINTTGSLNPIYDSLILPINTDLNTIITEDIHGGSGYWTVWQDVTVQGPTLPAARTTLTIDTASSQTYLRNGSRKRIRLGALRLDNVRLDSDATFIFERSQNILTLDNSILNLDIDPVFISTSPTFITALGGESQIIGWDFVSPSNTQISVQSGATLEFNSSGLLSNSDPNLWLRFNGDSTVNIDNGTLRFRYSAAQFDNGDFNIINGGVLDISGSETYVRTRDIDVDSSTIQIETGTVLEVTNVLTLDNASVDMIANSTLIAPTIELTGTSTFNGNNTSEKVRVANLQTVDNSATVLNIDGTNSFKIENANFGSNLTLNINRGFVEINNNVNFTGPSINIDAAGSLSIFTNLPDPMDATIVNDGRIFLSEDTILSLEAPFSLTNTGGVETQGYIVGNGTIAGSGGSLTFSTDQRSGSEGTLSPGSPIAGPGLDMIGQITTDSGVLFYAGFPTTDPGLISSGLFNGGIYQVDLRLNAGVEENDLLSYGDGDVDLTLLKELQVRVLDNPTADDLDNKEFTVIAAQNAGSAGTIVTNGQSINIVEDVSVPALIDFFIVDNNTNSKPDVTLAADKQTSNLQKHPGAGTRNRQGSSNLLTNSANNGNTAINNALNTLTNGQVAPQLNSVHAEPFSSYITVSLEHTDMLVNTVMNQAGFDRSYGASTANVYVDPNSLKRFWIDANYYDGHINGSGDLGNFGYILSSFTMGQDLVSTQENLAGIFFSYGDQKMHEHDLADQDFKGDLYYLGMYFEQRNLGIWDFRCMAGYGYGDHESKRIARLSNLASIETGQFNSHVGYLGLEGRTTWIYNDWVRLVPQIGFDYIYYWQEALEEQGNSSLSLRVDSADSQAMIFSLGLNAQFQSLSNEYSLYPEAFIRYEHDFYANSRSAHEVQAALSDHPSQKQTFVGQNRGEDSLYLGIGIGSDITYSSWVNSSLIYTVHTHGHELGGYVTGEVNW